MYKIRPSLPGVGGKRVRVALKIIARGGAIRVRLMNIHGQREEDREARQENLARFSASAREYQWP